jgi:hypothetical protein
VLALGAMTGRAECFSSEVVAENKVNGKRCQQISQASLDTSRT